eukprot:17818-Heterococcus_DN1.PRE.1
MLLCVHDVLYWSELMRAFRHVQLCSVCEAAAYAHLVADPAARSCYHDTAKLTSQLRNSSSWLSVEVPNRAEVRPCCCLHHRNANCCNSISYALCTATKSHSSAAASVTAAVSQHTH